LGTSVVGRAEDCHGPRAFPAVRNCRNRRRAVQLSVRPRPTQRAPSLLPARLGLLPTGLENATRPGAVLRKFLPTNCPDEYAFAPPERGRTTPRPRLRTAHCPAAAAPHSSGCRTASTPAALPPPPAAAAGCPAPAIAATKRRSAITGSRPCTSPGRCCRHAPGSSHCSSGG